MFRFSLRSMMIGVTLVCILLGGRIEYLRQMAMFHRREYRILGEIAVRTPTGPYDPGIEPMVAMMNYHLQMEAEYNQAILKPWTMIEENPPPETAP